MMQKDRSAQVWRFLGLSFALTWVPWLVVVLSGGSAVALPWALLVLVGGFGPTAAAFVLTYRAEGRNGIRRLWEQGLLLRFGLRWYMAILLLFPALVAGALLLAGILGETVPRAEGLRALAAHPLLVLPWLLGLLITGPVAQEYGWRGYALERMLLRWGPARSSLALGSVWAVWHLPLFLMQGMPQLEQSFWVFAPGVVADSFLFTAVYLGTGRSVESAILLHYVRNVALTVLPRSSLIYGCYAGLSALLALAIVLFWRIHAANAVPQRPHWEQASG